jgi:hypothetical protein
LQVLPEGGGGYQQADVISVGAEGLAELIEDGSRLAGACGTREKPHSSSVAQAKKRRNRTYLPESIMRDSAENFL